MIDKIHKGMKRDRLSSRVLFTATVCTTHFEIRMENLSCKGKVFKRKSL